MVPVTTHAILAWILAWLTLAAAPPPADAGLSWKRLQPGVEYTAIGERGKDARAADGRIHVVRIDAKQAPFVAAMASAGDRQPRTAAAWCRERKLAVAINLGMYAQDKLTNVGHAQAPGHVNNARWSEKYKSVLAFAPRRAQLPAAALIDLDTPGAQATLSGYGGAVQNLRLIRAPGQSVWGKQERRWSEAAVAADNAGRILFIFWRQPWAMNELNDKLLSLPLGIAGAMHVEGGPEASLSIHAGGVDLDLNGGYETGLKESDGEKAQWPIPNVLGVARR